MKILIVGSDKLDSEYGGGQIYVKNLVAGLATNQHDVCYMSIAFANISLPRKLWTNDTNIKELQLIVPANWLVECKKTNLIDEIAAIYKELRLDVTHAHGWKELACLSANRAGIPCVVTAHHGGIVCPAGALLNPRDEICTVPADQHTCLLCCVRNIRGSKLWLPLLRSIPLDVQLRLGQWLQARRFIYFITPLGTLALSIRNKLAAIKTLGNYATCLIAPSPAISEALVRNGISENKITVVPHRIPLPKRLPLRSGFGKSTLRFIFVGRISYVKGVHVMLEAFSRLKQNSYELHIVGGAVTKPEHRYMAELQKKYKLLNVIWHGNQPHQDIPGYIAQCDAMVHPAIFLEVFGLTIAESFAVGRPVIASRCGGAEAQILDGENGLLVPPNDPGALHNALMRLIENPEMLQKMADKTCVAHSLDSHILDLEKVYKASLYCR